VNRKLLAGGVIGAVAVAVLAVVALTVAGLNGGGGSGSSGSAPGPAAAAAPGPADQGAITAVYRRAAPAVVFVQSERGGAAGPVGEATGSGFVVDTDGTIVTNEHVVSDARDVRVRFSEQGPEIAARVLGTDPGSDLAVLKVDPSRVRGSLTALPLADSDRVVVGSTAIAIGYPFGLEETVTAGIVSGTGRDIPAPNGFTIPEAIQTDAAINPGNSGGPLLDARGRVIGVNAQIRTAGAGSRGNVGIGFAVPSNTVREVLPVLERGQEVRRAYLGVSTSDLGLDEAQARGLGADQRGALVQQVVPGGPAAQSGVARGDVIVRIDGQPVQGSDDVARAIADHQPGDRVEVEVLRGGDRRTLTVTLGERPPEVR
jgi:S1-C subfamily serine protease